MEREEFPLIYFWFFHVDKKDFSSIGFAVLCIAKLFSLMFKLYSYFDVPMDFKRYSFLNVFLMEFFWLCEVYLEFFALITILIFNRFATKNSPKRNKYLGFFVLWVNVAIFVLNLVILIYDVIISIHLSKQEVLISNTDDAEINRSDLVKFAYYLSDLSKSMLYIFPACFQVLYLTYVGWLCHLTYRIFRFNELKLLNLNKKPRVNQEKENLSKTIDMDD